YRCVGLFDPYGDGSENRPDGWYYDCNRCHHIEMVEGLTDTPPPELTLCSICTSPTQPRRTVTPKGFRTEWGQQRAYRGGGREVVGHTSVARLLPGDAPDEGDLIFADRLRVGQRRGGLLVVNGGDGEAGFQVCPECGFALDPARPHRRPMWVQGRWEFRECPQTSPNLVV